MDIFVTNTDFKVVGMIECYESAIWTDRFDSPGDFEIYTPYDEYIINTVKKDYYLDYYGSEKTMIVENIQISSDVEEGVKIIITGSSLESIINRRIIWNDTKISGNLQDGIETLINENIINPSDEKRKIPNFVFDRSEDEFITSIEIETAQYCGEEIGEVVKELCNQHKIGYKVIKDSSNIFHFSLYSGVDRSYAQHVNPYVVFSPTFDNLVNSNYIESVKEYKNVALVVGDGTGTSKRYTTAESVEGVSGLYRREVYVDAGSITTDEIMSTAEYYEALRQKGVDSLNEHKETKSFEGEVEASIMFKYGKDFFIGDVVQIINEYGMEARSRVSEFVISDSTSDGYKTYPTFVTVEDDKEDKES